MKWNRLATIAGFSAFLGVWTCAIVVPLLRFGREDLLGVLKLWVLLAPIPLVMFGFLHIATLRRLPPKRPGQSQTLPGAVVINLGEHVAERRSLNGWPGGRLSRLSAFGLLLPYIGVMVALGLTGKPVTTAHAHAIEILFGLSLVGSMMLAVVSNRKQRLGPEAEFTVVRLKLELDQQGFRGPALLLMGESGDEGEEPDSEVFVEWKCISRWTVCGQWKGRPAHHSIHLRDGREICVIRPYLGASDAYFVDYARHFISVDIRESVMT